ncbi:MAG: hypothetical protein JWO10_1934 [Microbacteriaceae bacterium]|nr:hypothetical protein [Microbacteriaceae bacterium]
MTFQRTAGAAHRQNHAIRRIIGVILVAAAITTGVLIAMPQQVSAAELGPGYQYRGQATSHLGGYRNPDGSTSYCINAGLPSAVGRETGDSGVVAEVNGLDPAAMVRLNLVLTRHGNTNDDNTAAAVAMAVWSIADGAAYDAEGGDVFVAGRAPQAQRVAIRELAADFRNEASAYVIPSGSASLALTIDPTNTALGWVDVAVQPASAAGTLTLVGGVFADTKSATMDGVSGTAHLPIRGTPTGDRAYRMSVTGQFQTDGGPAPTVHLYSTLGAQSLTAAGTGSLLVLSASAVDAADRLVPAITSVAQQAALVGETVIDTVKATGVPASGMLLTWAGYLQQLSLAAPTCTDKTRVFESTEPLRITADGEYSSEQFPVLDSHAGTLLWVATATVNGEVVAEGECGDPLERSVLSAVVHLPVVSG